MNKIKEKKLNAIKSDILEVKDFVLSHSNNKVNQHVDNDSTKFKVDDTVTLTKIVDFDESSPSSNILTNVRQDLQLLKSTLVEHEKILKEILDKLK